MLYGLAATMSSLSGHHARMKATRAHSRRTAVRSATLLIAAVALVLAVPLPPAFAQELEELIEEQVLPQFTYIGEGGFTYQGDADIDGGGSVQVNRFDAAIASQTNLVEGLRWSNTFFFGADDYDFDGGGSSAGNPWETILMMRLGTKLAYRINEQWGVWGGGVFMFSPETGADWGRSFTGGGRVGVDYRHSKTFFVSVGLAVISQIEDDVKLAPSVGLNWLPHEQWAVRVGAVPVSGGSAAAAEVAYQIAEPVDLGLGVLYQQRRFRLDDSGVARNGVGEDNTLPLRLRVGWSITPHVSVHFVGGVVLGGQLQLDDANGNRLNKQDYDPAPYFGVRVLGGF